MFLMFEALHNVAQSRNVQLLLYNLAVFSGYKGLRPDRRYKIRPGPRQFAIVESCVRASILKAAKLANERTWLANQFATRFFCAYPMRVQRIRQQLEFV